MDSHKEKSGRDPGPKEETVDDILNSEAELVRNAPEKYGEYFAFAMETINLLNGFVASIDGTRFIFSLFLSQVRKNVLLAILSTVRLHRVQALMDMRQVLEAGASVAFAISHTDIDNFADKDEDGVINSTKELAAIRYRWLAEHHPAASRSIKGMKDNLNDSIAHANIIYGMLNFRPDFERDKFETPFFDYKDEHHIKGDLWTIGDVAFGLMDLFYGINRDQGAIKFSQDFLARMKALRAKDTELKKAIMSTERFKQAQER